MKIKIIFFGSGNYPIPILERLCKDSIFELSLITCPQDKLVGKKQILTKNPAKKWAVKNNIRLLTVSSLKEENKKTVIEEIKKINPDLGLVGFYGLLIPKEIFSIPKYGIINIHFSLLPKYRGAAPVQWAIINGDREIGITILKIIEKFDAGEIIYQQKYPLVGNETPEILYQVLFEKTALFLPEVIEKYINGELKPQKQDETKVIYAPKITTNDGKIDWTKKPEKIERLIRGVNPNPGAWTEVKIGDQNKRLKILKAHLDNKKLIIDEVQLEGKNPVSFKEFEKTHPEIKIYSNT